MSAIDPVFGWRSSHPQMAAPAKGSTAEDMVSGSPPCIDHWLKKSINWQATRVVLVAGLIPLNWAILKNSRRPKCTITPTAAVNHHPPKLTTSAPKQPTARPISTLMLPLSV